MNKMFFTISSLFLLFFACSDENVSLNNGDDTDGIDYYTREVQPSLSADRSFVYYISVDTISSSKNGIYSFSTATPRRVKILESNSYRSVSISANKRKLAFLDNGQIKYFVFYDSTLESSRFNETFNSVVTVSNEILVGERNGFLYLIDEETGISDLGEGYDPTLYQIDTIVYLQHFVMEYYGIMMRDIKSDKPDTLKIIQVSGKPRWVSLEPLLRRFVYTVESTPYNLIYSGSIGSSTQYFIDSTTYLKALMLNFNLIIYPPLGTDGRFYQTTFDGSFSTPFWYSEIGP